MLGVRSNNVGADVFSKAKEAVLANDPDSLKSYITKLRSDRQRISLLVTSCQCGHEGCVRVLLENGTSPNSLSANNLTLLQICAKNGHLNSIRILLEYGANINTADGNDQTPLFISLRAGHATTAHALIHAGASLTKITKDGQTILHAAVKARLPNTLRLILVSLQSSLEEREFQRFVNLSDDSGYTPLHLAVARVCVECVGVLCACEAVQSSPRDRWNRTPADMANSDSCREILQYKGSKNFLVSIESGELSASGGLPRLVIGQLHVLPHHKLSDVHPLVSNLLTEYCSIISTHNQPIPSTHIDPSTPLPKINNSFADRVNFEVELAAALRASQETSQKYTGYLEKCSEYIKQYSAGVCGLGLNGESVSSYQIGSHRWTPGQLSGDRPLFSVFNESRDVNSKRHIRVYLKGLEDDCFDQLAFSLMTPVSQLREYTELALKHKALAIHGTAGSGKTQLARALANCIKARKKRTQVLYASLHPNFKRDDLFRMLHLNGLLSQYNDTSNESCVVLLDDLSSVQSPGVLSELLSLIEYRDSETPLWVNDVHGRDGAVIFQCGHYYLKENAYFIATMATEETGGQWVDQFAHVVLYQTSACSVLLHHLNARLVHSLDGLVPHTTQPISRVVWWVYHVWILFNEFVRRIGLQQSKIGVRYFIQCPVESNNIDAVIKWLVSLWTHHISPALRNALSSKCPSGSEDSQLLSECLSACIDVVFRPHCPLSYQARERFLSQLRDTVDPPLIMNKQVGTNIAPDESGPKASAASTSPTRCSPHKPPLPPQPGSVVPPQPGSVVPPQPGSVVSPQPGSVVPPQPSSMAPPQPGSMVPPQPGSMVSYEDMLRDSPRNKDKREKSPSNLHMRKQKPTNADIEIRSPEPEPTPTKDTVIIRHRRSSTLTKLRSKTRSFFSKDNNGHSTLPRLFKRGNRNSLHLPNERATSVEPTDVKQLEEMFTMLSEANSMRFDDQLAPAPKPVGDDKKKDLDNFIEVFSSVDSSRIEEQRSPPPESPSKKKSVPKYILPTGSPLRDLFKPKHSNVANVPRFSTPNLSNDAESQLQAFQSFTNPSQRRNANASLSSYDSDLLFTDDQSSYGEVYYSASNIHDLEPYVEDSPQSVKSNKVVYSYRERFDSNANTEPTRRRNTPFESSTAKSTPRAIHNTTSPLAIYSSPVASSTNKQGSPRHSVEAVKSPLKSRAKSVADIPEVDELGGIDDVDLFRAASEGDLMQSSANDSFLELAENRAMDTQRRPSYGYQSSIDSDAFESESLQRVSSRTSGYVSDNTSRVRTENTSLKGYLSQRRSTVSDKPDMFSPTQSLRKGNRRASDGSSVYGSNLLYSASLGCDSLPRLNTSRDRLGSFSSDVTTEM